MNYFSLVALKFQIQIGKTLLKMDKIAIRLNQLLSVALQPVLEKKAQEILSESGTGLLPRDLPKIKRILEGAVILRGKDGQAHEYPVRNFYDEHENEKLDLWALPDDFDLDQSSYPIDIIKHIRLLGKVEVFKLFREFTGHEVKRLSRLFRAFPTEKLYSHDELYQGITIFLDGMKKNRTGIIETGYWESELGLVPSKLSNLYPAELGYRKHRKQERFIREVIFDLKVDLLLASARLVQKRDLYTFMREIDAAFCRHLEPSLALKCFALDRKFAMKRLCKESVLYPGGLTDLLDFIAYIIDDEERNWYHNARKNLGNLFFRSETDAGWEFKTFIRLPSEQRRKAAKVLENFGIRFDDLSSGLDLFSEFYFDGSFQNSNVNPFSRNVSQLQSKGILEVLRKYEPTHIMEASLRKHKIEPLDDDYRWIKCVETGEEYRLTPKQRQFFRFLDESFRKGILRISNNAMKKHLGGGDLVRDLFRRKAQKKKSALQPPLRGNVVDYVDGFWFFI